ncbi:aromatic ring-hydroxylating oxygenase subunit alpha [Mycobacteroides abscessus]|uniref:aromatic ring-hydroxylating oxygenase subunit alpha n=1 Tax=Mycobacteroides abscessus TaxID=36809 RepID=UPI0009274166|nr:aromatic ring-hydroxylating dioxygenase subunit alpha [Mycobacteroides abscessus]MDO3333955.1 aromatic ring-hydroxylating dioxygenase subunit alpha [Mycobacteroides abscessus subsp. bolletii]QSM91473.1 aromatic ring-hydroxylating dioxygenase subunit alpha [Mycobacteroides abscessus subsp. bolletii]SIB91195.1 dioxygenase subunit alpha yeaW [Mycobacteroides abscessus subsp. bolletii]SKS86448.1 dioxygenase subunit alpha yeaW [Mycobacteroides abscessus subsp. bolletii]SKT10221.1 dioxygenase sub
MPQHEATELTRRVLAHMATDTLDVEDDVAFESRDAFVGSERFTADGDMLSKEPHVVGWSGEVAPGEYVTKDVMGVPVLITRTRDGILHAFLNACSHRGAQVATGYVAAQSISCPYHGWTYGLNGRLTGVPARRMFAGTDLDKRSLIEIPISERCGLLTVGLSGDVELDAHLDTVEDSLSEYDFTGLRHYETRRFEVAANWKLTIDINFEGYHIKFAHSETLAPLATNNSVYDIFGRHCRWAFPLRNIVEFAEMPESDWPPDFLGTLAYFLFPTTVLIVVPGTVQMLRVYPGSRPETSVVYLTQSASGPVDTDTDRQWYTGLLDATCRVFADEDIPMAQACQRGLDGGLPNVVFGRNEPLLHHLSRVWQEAIEIPATEEVRRS